MAQFHYQPQSPAPPPMRSARLIANRSSLGKAIVELPNGEMYELSNFIIKQLQMRGGFDAFGGHAGLMSIDIEGMLTDNGAPTAGNQSVEEEMTLLDYSLASAEPEWIADLWVMIGAEGGTVERDAVQQTHKITGAAACAAVRQRLTERFGPSWEERNRTERKKKIKRVRPR
jgi:hypothetical protein